MLNLKKIRAYYQIPRRKKLSWAVIVEKTKNGQKSCRLGVLLIGTDKVIDVMARKFIQTNLLQPVERQTYPAKRRNVGSGVLFSTKNEKVHELICIRRDDVESEYFSTRYSKELMETFVF